MFTNLNILEIDNFQNLGNGGGQQMEMKAREQAGIKKGYASSNVFGNPEYWINILQDE